MKEQVTNLEQAYNELRKLNIEMTTEELTNVSAIMCGLANSQFSRGLDAAEKIYTKFI